MHRLKQLLKVNMKGCKARKTDKLIFRTTPNNLSGNTRSRLKVGRKYYSGCISNGAWKGLAGKLKDSEEHTDNPIEHVIVPAITIGNTKRISLGQADSS